MECGNTRCTVAIIVEVNTFLLDIVPRPDGALLLSLNVSDTVQR